MKKIILFTIIAFIASNVFGDNIIVKNNMHDPSTVLQKPGDTKDPWDIQFTYSVQSFDELGVETNGMNIYTTDQIMSGGFFKYQMDGTYVGQFTITGVPYALREITYDGQYFYGCTFDSNVLYVLDLDNEQLIGTITTAAEGNVTSIAYDCDSDGFWLRCCYGLGDDVILVDRSGTYIRSIAFEPELYTGLAYDPYSDGGPYLWAFNEFDGIIYQIQISSGTLTGTSFDVCTSLAIWGLSGGLFIADDEFLTGTVTIGGLLSGEVIFGYELCSSSTPPDPPAATAATTDGTLTFYANWDASTGATGYYLDVATDANFTAYLSGYENLDVSNVLTYSVTAIRAIDHYYRIRAYNNDGTSDNSNIITVSGSTLPVELSAFTATYDHTNGYTSIEWATVSETDVIGFNVYRSTEDYFDTAKQINVDVIAGHGTTTEMNSYEFIDDSQLDIGTTYYYWLESVEFGGISVVYSSINITPEEGSGGYVDDFDSNSLSNFPNPIKNSTTISYSIKGMLRSEPVEINIYNMLGQLADTVEGRNGTATWNTSNHSTGIYFYKLNTDSYSEIKKMMVAK